MFWRQWSKQSRQHWTAPWGFNNLAQQHSEPEWALTLTVYKRSQAIPPPPPRPKRACLPRHRGAFLKGLVTLSIIWHLAILLLLSTWTCFCLQLTGMGDLNVLNNTVLSKGSGSLWDLGGFVSFILRVSDSMNSASGLGGSRLAAGSSRWNGTSSSLSRSETSSCHTDSQWFAFILVQFIIFFTSLHSKPL